MLHGSEHECYSLTTPESLSLIVMRGPGRFPGLSPNSLILVPTEFRIQDPSSNPRAFVSAPPTPPTSKRRLVKFPVERGGDLGHTLASASNLPGDLDEVTLIKRISYCARELSEVDRKRTDEHAVAWRAKPPGLSLLPLTCR